MYADMIQLMMTISLRLTIATPTATPTLINYIQYR